MDGRVEGLVDGRVEGFVAGLAAGFEAGRVDGREEVEGRDWGRWTLEPVAGLRR